MVMKQYLLSLISQNKPHRLFVSLMTTLLFIIVSSSLHAASVTASLNKNVANENEVVQLTLRADFSDTGNGPDLTPLERDFEILGKSQNSQFSFNLGTSTALNFWVITLMPKSVGTVEIPPIKIGDLESQPIRLTVKSSPQLLDGNGNPPVMIKTEVSEVEPYLQQEVILSVKLYTSVALQNANRSVPSHPDLVLERLIDDQVDYQTVNGTQYQVITREYLAFPQRSGQLTIPPQTIQAMINTSTGRRMIKVQSEPLNLQVTPIPASFTGDAWLPSKKVTVSTSLDKTNDAPRVGDTLIWTIDIKAEGALPEQIPTLDFNSTRNYKLYPKPPQFSNQKNAAGVTGNQTIVVEVVPTEEGKLSLPDINITYWNTDERAISVASASTDTIDIAPLPNSSGQSDGATTSNKPTISDPLPAQSRSVAPISLAKKAVEPTKTEAQPDLLPTPSSEGKSLRDYLISGLLFLTVLLLGAWLFIWLKRKKQDVNTDHDVPTLQEFAPLSTVNEESAYKALIACCQQDNLQSLRPSLLEWARHRWGDDEIRSVDDIKRLTSVQVTQLLMEAEIMLYSNNPAHEWQGEPLADALEEFTSGQEKPSKASQLKTLYPNF
ncbi:oxygen tolerance protein BatD [Marinomonas alcarazii]|uniref:Oxygen tolerance protein BatD n=1 Tax=Marinomonas alcarazii TaxID=491949 RepID=A0A318VHB9_9GAMM|nr:BatD family protein [Marinomonas alcarazii]PYF83239.1 oxygen tolerance protein BatD [Marinomonas alcarazii]